MRKRYSSSGAARLRAWALLILSLVILLAILFNNTVAPVVESVAENAAKIKTASVINSIVLKEVGSNAVTYESLIHVDRDDSGKVLSITTDIVKMNQLKSRIITEVQQTLNGNIKSCVDIPLGTLVGGHLFYGRGPNVNLRLTLSGDVAAEFKGSFTSAGINQTRHQIYLNVCTDVYSFLPGFSAATKVNTDVLVAETVIVGTVPDMMLNTK